MTLSSQNEGLFSFAFGQPVWRGVWRGAWKQSGDGAANGHEELS